MQRKNRCITLLFFWEYILLFHPDAQHQTFCFRGRIPHIFRRENRMLPGFHSTKAMLRRPRSNILSLCTPFRKIGRNNVRRFDKAISSLYFRSIRTRIQGSYITKVHVRSSTYHRLFGSFGKAGFKLLFIFVHSLIGNLMYFF